MSQYKHGFSPSIDAGETLITIGHEITVGASHDPIAMMHQLPIMLNHEALDRLVSLIATTFTDDHLKWVCAISNIDEKLLSGSNRSDRARSLVEYAARHQNDLYELLHACESESSHTNWPRWRELYSATNQ